MCKLSATVEQFLQAKEAAFRSKATITKYRDFLMQFTAHVGGERDIREIRSEEIRDFLATKRRDGLTPASLDTYFRTLHTFWRWVETECDLSHNPMRAVERPRVPKTLPPYLTDEELQELLRVAKESRNAERDWAILLLLLDTGVRAGELVNLRVEDIDFKERTIKVYGKDHEERRIPVSQTTVEALRNYLGRRTESPGSPVFLSAKTRKALTVCGLREIIRRLGERAGLQRRVYPHLFRHTFAYRWIRMGGNLEKLRCILGHSRLDTTSIYARARLEDVLEEHHKLRPVDNLVENLMILSLF